MLNPELDFAGLRAELSRRGRIQIRDFFQKQPARELLECLENDVPWTLAMQHQGASRTLPIEEYSAMSETERSRLLGELAREATGQYGFAYESYMMIEAYTERRDPGLLLHRVSEFLNSYPFLKFARALTGFPEIHRASAQATRYRAGHFLRLHTDQVEEEGRLVAYVINLTPEWHADFGGLLHFKANDGSIAEVYYPWFNSLTLFKVPAWHFVSPVASYADRSRLAITGWFHKQESDAN